MVYHLKGAQPKIIEYRVGPIKIDNSSWPLTSEHIVQEGDAIDYRMRPVSSGEYERMETLIAENMRMLSHLSSVPPSFNLQSRASTRQVLTGALLLESYGRAYDDGSMWWTDAAPRGYTRSTRQTWIWLMWNAEGLYYHCLGASCLPRRSEAEVK